MIEIEWQDENLRRVLAEGSRMAEKVMRFMPLVQQMIFVPRATNTGLWGIFTNRSLCQKIPGLCSRAVFKDAIFERPVRKDVHSSPSKTVL